MMPGRTIAIGDIHGSEIALSRLLRAIEPSFEDTIITLGDYVDGGIDSAGVLERLIGLQARCRLVSLLGNHEQMMLDAREGSNELEKWLQFGGMSTLASYPEERLDAVPRRHWNFLESCQFFHEIKLHIFVHANYDPGKAMEDQRADDLLWRSLRDSVPGPHISGKIAVVGHTPQGDGEILDIGHLVCIDTACWTGGWLTALDVGSGQMWIVNERGETRSANRRQRQWSTSTR